MNQHLEQITTDYLRRLETRTSFDDLLPFYHPDIEQIEFPNSLVKNKMARNLEDLRQASERGQAVLTREVYGIRNIYSSSNTVIVEATWTGTLAIPLGSIPAGGTLTAHFAQFFEYRDDRIIRQRNYDCFEPFA